MKEIPQYILAITYLGFAISLMAFIPIYTKKIKITYIIPLLIIGAILYVLGVPLPWPDPLWELQLGKIITEIIVIISLMTAGLKIGVNYKKDHWKRPLSLIVITMPLFIIGVFIIAHYILHLNGPVSLLLAAVLAPTDPVLASEIQLQEHQDSNTKDTGFKYVLTAEAGLNDGFAFPIVFLAILWSKASNFGAIDWWEYLSYYVVYKMAIGIAIGALIGYAFSKFIYRHNKNTRYNIQNGFLAVALTFFSYGIAEIAHTYGFLSVFATGIFLRFVKPNGEEKETQILNFVEQTEKLLVTLWAIFFGGALLSGILSYTDINGILVSLGIVLILRPILGYLGVFRLKESNFLKWSIAFFGIKGIGSFFYLSYALLHGKFEDYNSLYGIVSYVILFSIIIHGLTSIRILDHLKKTNKNEG